MQPHQVLLVGGPHLAPEHLARERLERDTVSAKPLLRLLETVIHLLDHVRDPADTGLAQADLELGMALQHAETEQPDERGVEAGGAIAQAHAEGGPTLAGEGPLFIRQAASSRRTYAADVIGHADAR